MPPRILIVDDEERLAEVTAVALEGYGFVTRHVASAPAALRALDSDSYDLVLSDLRMPGMTGKDLLKQLRAARPETPVVIMTAYASVRDAVDLVKDGAFDYISKPFEMDDMVATIRRALQLSETIADNARLHEELSRAYGLDGLIGSSPALQDVLRQITEVSASRATVLLQGESGTGKELIARAIHNASPRRLKPFVAVNCAAIPETLLESELFGHVKGAFTGAMANREGRFLAANGGTLFLDEIGDMPLLIQAKVLRAIQEQTFEPVGGSRSVTVDVRFVSASHRDLRKQVDLGAFREDLFYRLNVFPIVVPPLRQRAGDVALLAAHFLNRYAAAMGKPLTGYSPAALRAMEAYAWPGNIRELQNCVERAVIVARGSAIEVGDLPTYLFEGRAKLDPASGLPADLDAELERIERDFILEALRKADGVQIRAAERLGVSERSFWHRLKKLDIKIGKKVD
jgi:DNA-binding NtrC family response regulator